MTHTSPPTDPHPRTPPRISPGQRGDVGVATWAFCGLAGRVSGTEPPKLFLTMGRQRALFRGWLRFAARLMPFGKLPRRETELVILRVAHLRSCDYEFDHHVALSRRFGVNERDLRCVRIGPDDPGWTARESAILATVDALVSRQDLTEQEWNHISAFLNDPLIIELVLLVGHYDMLATFLNTLRISPDRHRR